MSDHLLNQLFSWPHGWRCLIALYLISGHICIHPPPPTCFCFHLDNSRHSNRAAMTGGRHKYCTTCNGTEKPTIRVGYCRKIFQPGSSGSYEGKHGEISAASRCLLSEMVTQTVAFSHCMIILCFWCMLILQCTV